MKALIITGNLVQDHEFIYPYYRLKEAGYDVIVALKDRKECLGILGTKIPCDNECEIITYEDLDFCYDAFDLVIIPGGAKCMEKLRQEQNVLDFIYEYVATGKTLGSICHGAQLLISAKVVKGKSISGYYSIRDDIINAGAEYVDAPFVIDENIISCPHYKYLGEWMKEVIMIAFFHRYT